MAANFPVPPDQQLLLQKDQHEFEIARLNIEKINENNAMWAAHWFKMRLLAYVFTGIMLFLILGFCTLAIIWNKDAIAMEIVTPSPPFMAGRMSRGS